MNDVMYETKMLNKALRHSNEYNQYIRTRERLCKEEALYQRTKEFSRRNLQIQCYADYNTLEDVSNLRREFADILSNQMVIDFLVAEQRVARMMRRVEEQLFENIDLDTEVIES